MSKKEIEREQEILKLNEEYTVNGISEKLGIGIHTVYKTLHRNGVHIKYYILQRNSEILNQYKNGRRMIDLSKEYELSYNQIYLITKNKKKKGV